MLLKTYEEITRLITFHFELTKTFSRWVPRGGLIFWDFVTNVRSPISKTNSVFESETSIEIQNTSLFYNLISCASIYVYRLPCPHSAYNRKSRLNYDSNRRLFSYLKSKIQSFSHYFKHYPLRVIHLKLHENLRRPGQNFRHFFNKQGLQLFRW